MLADNGHALGRDEILFFAQITWDQGWEFAHWFSERNACFLRKNEQMSDSLKKTSNSLIFGEQPEQFSHIAH